MFRDAFFIVLAVCASCANLLSAAEGEAAPRYLYKVVSIEAWDNSWTSSTVELSAMDDKFIHLATEEQLDRIIAKFWQDVPAYVILKLDTSKLKGRLVFEINPGGFNKYYHLYHGSIPMSAVVDVKRVDRPLPKSKDQQAIDIVSRLLHDVVESMDLRHLDHYFSQDLQFVVNQRTMNLDGLRAYLEERFHDLQAIEVRQPFTEVVASQDKIALALTVVLTSKRGIRREIHAMAIATIQAGKIERVDQLIFPN